MSALRPQKPGPAAFWRNQDGSTMVEFGIVISLFLLIFFGLIDFGRLAFHVVASERAVQAGVRIAASRPAACAGVPEMLTRAPDAPGDIEFGTSCNFGGPVCMDPGLISCSGSAGNATAAEVWQVVQPTLPPNASIANLRFSYGFDPNLGFLGGPYVPVVTVELEDVGFDFITPLSSLAVAAGAAPGGPAWDNGLTLPSQSVSLPGEDLAQGEDG
jgi:hypothetical protein